MRRMRVIGVVVAVLVWAGAAAAAVPQSLHYSGQLKTAGGLFTGTIDVTFSLFETLQAADPFWQDTQAVQVADGRFHVQLGPLSAADVNVSAMAVGVSVDTDLSMEKVAVASVPYALRAVEADNAATVGGETADAFADAAHTHTLADLVLEDALDFSELKDTLTLDASTSIQIPTDESLTFKAGTDGTTTFYGNGDVMLGLSGAAGNVGIGASPTASFKFSVNGNTRLLGDGFVTGNLGIGTGPATDYKVKAAGTKSVYSQGYSFLEGSVGIGAAPTSSYQLTVTGDVLFYQGRMGVGGTPSSMYQLRVVGDTALSGDVTSTGTVKAASFEFEDGTELTTAPSGGGGTTMVLQKMSSSGSGEPAKCPSGFTEADFQAVWVPGNKTNQVRTCYRTDKQCTVLYLARMSSGFGGPANCPLNFQEADNHSVWVDGSKTNNVRSCYHCP